MSRLGLAFLLTLAAGQAATYDAVSNFSATSNPNGPWSYGWKTNLGGAFTLNSLQRSSVYAGIAAWEGPEPAYEFFFPFVAFNNTGATRDYASGVSQPANMLNLHPSYSGKFSVVRWTAPTTGAFRVVGLFQGIDTRQTTTDVHVLQNSATSLLSANINGFGAQTAFNFTRSLAAGDTLDFAVGWGSNGGFSADSTGLAVTIVQEMAQPAFTLLTPVNNAVVSPGQPVTVTWTGGDPSWTINTVLIDRDTFTAVYGFGHSPNSGSRVVTIPTNPVPGSGCGHRYLFYISNSQGTSSTYGADFTLVCPMSVADGDVAGLIAAIRAANANPGPDIINLAPNGNYVLTAVVDSPDEYNSPGAVGLPAIRGPLTINGNGATIQRSAAPGTPNFTVLAVSGRTWDASPPPGCAGNSFNCSLTLNRTTLAGGAGSGLHLNNATGLVQGSTIAGNMGTGISNHCSHLTVLNSTISHNTHNGGFGGGGIFSWGVSCGAGSPTTKISFTTLYENRSWAGDSISTAYDSPGSVVVKNSILASPTRAAQAVCWQGGGGAVSAGYNLVADASCGFTSPGDMVIANPLLGPLANNGGPTPTHLPLTGSPAIDAVPSGAKCTDVNANPVATDQRGVARPQGAACDIGSVDVAADTTPPVITPNVSGTLGSGGWYRSNVTVTWTVADAQSGIASSSGCGATVLTTDTGGVTVTCSATNNANLSASQSVTVKIDQTAPAMSSSRTPLPNAAGWNNTNVTVQFGCIDGTSGVALLNPVSVTLTGEGAGQSAASACTDNAGNSAATAMGGINIDKSKPLTSGVTANPNPAPINTSPVVGANLSDRVSGLVRAEYSVNGSAPATLAAASGAAAAVNGTLPALVATGVYEICVHAIDQAGNVGLDECLLLPVYAPNGGFVTGGGWIDSPAGAYSANPMLAGKATFGFESRYQPGAQVPTGNTQFQFRVADLNFKGTSYEWLVVAGARAQYKGSGTINGSGNFGFILTAIDGALPGGGGQDRFRIKITGPGGVVYDNQMNASDNSEPTTVLGGGSIVIHTAP